MHFIKKQTKKQAEQIVKHISLPFLFIIINVFYLPIIIIIIIISSSSSSSSSSIIKS